MLWTNNGTPQMFCCVFQEQTNLSISHMNERSTMPSIVDILALIRVRNAKLMNHTNFFEKVSILNTMYKVKAIIF